MTIMRACSASVGFGLERAAVCSVLRIQIVQMGYTKPGPDSAKYQMYSSLNHRELRRVTTRSGERIKKQNMISLQACEFLVAKRSRAALMRVAVS